MCGRFFVDEELSNELEEAVAAAYKQALLEKEIRLGEVLPTDKAFVLTGENGKKSCEMMSWGYQITNKKQPIINARRETILQKPLFCEDFLNRRCLVPARGFYEWNDKKDKYYFTRTSDRMIYMAGIYTRKGDETKFTIITTSANESVVPYHDRMPIIIEDNEIERYLLDFPSAKAYLYRQSESMKARKEEQEAKDEYEQIHIFNTFNL